MQLSKRHYLLFTYMLRSVAVENDFIAKVTPNVVASSFQPVTRDVDRLCVNLD